MDIPPPPPLPGEASEGVSHTTPPDMCLNIDFSILGPLNITPDTQSETLWSRAAVSGWGFVE